MNENYYKRTQELQNTPAKLLDQQLQQQLTFTTALNS